MHGAHAARPTPKRTSSRKRLMVVILAPAVVLLPLTAQATIGRPAQPQKAVVATAKVTKPAAKVTKSVATLPGRWRKSWSPGLDLTINGAQANFVALSKSMASLATQTVVSTATFRTNWVDVRALMDGPNIAQQGLSVKPPQFKLQIAHGPNLVAAVFDEHLIPHLNLVLERVVRRHGRKHSRREIDRPGQRH